MGCAAELGRSFKWV